MGRIKLPMGIMDTNIRDVTVQKDFLTITADVGAAPNYVGKVEIELSPDDFTGSSAGVAFWVIRKVIPKLLLRAIRRG